VGSLEVGRNLDVSVKELRTLLTRSPDSVPVKVHMRAGRANGGRRDLSAHGRQTDLVGQRMFPDNRIDPDFVKRLAEMQKVAGVNKKPEFFFICSSGGRGKMAPPATAVFGLTRCRSGGGFEGPIDSIR
jgi:hypothetical protein